MTRRFAQVDVFTDRAGFGNPVAVVLDAEGISDEDMARFARWTNLSETTFVLAPTMPGADYLVRIFTPTEELPFAGHPTVGTCHAWLEAAGVPADPDRIVQQCGVGLVELRRHEGRLAFATPPLMKSGSPTAAELAQACEALGLASDEIVDAAWIDNGPGWLGVLIDDPARLAALSPSLTSRPKYGVVAPTGAPAGSDQPALVVRAFFHADGTREDPVTGSLNGGVAQWLLGSGRLSSPYVASQGTAMQRDGRVHVHEADGEIWIGGHAVTVVDGTVQI